MFLTIRPNSRLDSREKQQRMKCVVTMGILYMVTTHFIRCCFSLESSHESLAHGGGLGSTFHAGEGNHCGGFIQWGLVKKKNEVSFAESCDIGVSILVMKVAKGRAFLTVNNCKGERSSCWRGKSFDSIAWVIISQSRSNEVPIVPLWYRFFA
jgi:hypothetical protein